MNTISRIVLSLCLAGGASLSANAGTLWATNISDNVSPSFTTADSLLAVTGYSDSNHLSQANLGTGGNWFGVYGGGNNGAIDGTESLTIHLANGVGLSGIGNVWTRSQVIISGFLSDPGFTDPDNYASGVTYGSGTLTYFYDWDSGTEHDFTFASPAASDGQTLVLNVFDPNQGGWQATVTRLDYSVVPEPAVLNLLAAGIGMLTLGGFGRKSR